MKCVSNTNLRHNDILNELPIQFFPKIINITEYNSNKYITIKRES